MLGAEPDAGGDEADLARAASEAQYRLTLAQVATRVSASVVSFDDLGGNHLKIAGIVVDGDSKGLLRGGPH